MKYTDCMKDGLKSIFYLSDQSIFKLLIEGKFSQSLRIQRSRRSNKFNKQTLEILTKGTSLAFWYLFLICPIC